MAEIRPIKALKYTAKAGELKNNVCPPYDIISDAEYKELLAGSPYNLVQLEKPEGENRYENAKKLFDKWFAEGIIERDAEEAIYVYAEDFEVNGKQYSLKGFICLCKLYPFSEGVVLPHENTLSGAKQDRFDLMHTTECGFSSIYGLYTDGERAVSSVVEKASEGKPDACFTDGEGVTHSLWRVTDKDAVKAICDGIAAKQIFIADGHHRYETGLKLRDAFAEEGKCEENRDFVLMTLVDMENDGLVVLPTHRLIHSMSVDKSALLASLAEEFTIEEYDDVTKAEEVLASLTDKKAFALYTGGDGFALLVKKGEMPDNCDGGLSALDVSVLHDLILEKHLGIDKENMAKQKNLSYTRSIDEAVAKVKDGSCSAAFILNATKVQEIKSVALSGGKMPQKSTYFYPKLKTGLVMNSIKER